MLWSGLACIVDYIVPLSFGAPGYWIRKKTWVDDLTAIDLSAKTYVVTGANSGLGYATSQSLAKQGAHVLMVCRNPSRGQAALEQIRAKTPSARLTLLIGDTSKLESVIKVSP